MAAGLLALAGAGGRATPVASAELNHAAVVVDTGDGVRKFCLAFPEESITGAEALRRIEVDAVFSTYAGKGQAVCKLSGVGCPADDCFCNPSKYWAYHRAGPGGEKYTFSSAGVSSTVVRNGDVEGWRWGGGAAPPPATVGEVCGVPEPPSRTAASSSGGGGSGSASASTTAPPTSAASPAPAPAGGEPPPTTAARGPAPAPSAAPRPAPGPTVVPPPGEAGAVAAPEGPVGTEDGAVPEGEAVPTTTEPAEAHATGEEAAPRRVGDPATPVRDTGDGGAGGQIGLAAFVVILGGVLVWRARLRRANVRP